MCTIVVLQRVCADFPVVIATNRDEFFARPSAGPTLLGSCPRIVGGRDLQAQGTWMAVSEHGMFAGVTNHRTFALPDKQKRSRGELVPEVLARQSAQGALELLCSLDARAYNPFNLMFGDAQGMFVAYGRPDARAVQTAEVPDGVHVLPNDRLDSTEFFKVGRAKSLLHDAAQASWPALQHMLEGVLCDRERPALEDLPEPPVGSPLDRPLLRELAALCVKTPTYGTRSSTIVALTASGVGRYLYADGPPDTTPFEDVLGLL